MRRLLSAFLTAVLLLTLLAFTTGGGCQQRELICHADTDCIGEQGDFGACLDMHCAFKDTACAATQLRFADNAGVDANLCVTKAELPDAGPPADAH